MKKKIISVILAGTMMMGTLAGCGGNKTTETENKTEGKTEETQQTAGTEEFSMADASEVDGTEISFWHSMGGVNGQAIDTLVKKFNDENEYGITVKAQYQGEYDDSLNKLKSAQIGNMGADLVQVYEIGSRFMIESGWITPMQQMIDADSYDLSQIEPNLAAYYTIDNQLYSMPFNSSTPIMYYNKEMFEKAGITEIPDSLEGIEAVGEKLLNEGGAGQVISLGIYGWFFEQFIGKQGLEYANNGNGRTEAATAVAFDSNGAAANILTAWKSLYDKGYAPNVGKGGDAGLADFSAGKSAITLGSTASLKQILQDVNGKFEVGTAYFPKVKSTDEGGVSIGGASLWALNNNDAKKTRATWEFVKFLISPESQAYWNAQTGYFPVTTAAQEEPVFKENVEKYPQFQTAIDQLHDSSPKYVGALLSVFPEARATIESEIENLLNGNADVKTAVKNMADAINKSIEEYNLVNQ
ncbi:ABC transporter substrate-binding protein [Lachnospiraceae bacterium AM25-11LB]|nr:ABC transporter substrate-binding protein [Lachnospiraceae bacterium AM25-22]RGD07539.1 ABC transporter substrate-binding protein [Lachnospiraceae bacterium AM25-11LB]RJW09743.1 ABC transporter substrate-binding protein [Lachnospiraceae bacterium AM25-40]RJW14231.1 ABC transporter substrate-binding protein [Lachnospiraceae bacterium AM25-39]